jgi:putative transposase
MHAQKADFEITRMTRLLGVSRSGYYAWVTRCAAGPGPQATRRAQVDQAVRAAHERSDRVDGAPRITAALARNGLVVDQKTVAASMRRQGIEGISPPQVGPGDHDPRHGHALDPGPGRGYFRRWRTGRGVDLGHHLSAHR